MRRLLRFLIDCAAIFVAGSIQFAASGDSAATVITCIGVALYGCWCHYDGFASGRES